MFQNDYIEHVSKEDISYIFQLDQTLPVSSVDIDSSISIVSRSLYWEEYFFGNDSSNSTNDFDSNNLSPALDVSVNGVLASLCFNLIIFVVAMASYEILRRLLPSVYAARKQRAHLERNTYDEVPNGSEIAEEPHLDDDSMLPLTWVGPLFGVSWDTVRRTAGLDGYFFLRYIRMCLRITVVSSFWAAVILVPVFASGHDNSEGWYHISMTNIVSGTWRMWVPCVFIYLFSGFCFFVMKQEYRHFIELRMDFLGKGDSNLHPQHHFSLMVENIPLELRSDRALFDYFNKLFPGKIHSASVVLNLPDLETLCARRLRVTRRLEKSIATFKATGERPTHITGRKRMNCCAIDLEPLDCSFSSEEAHLISMDGPLPDRGTRVDSISYYARELAEFNKEVLQLQKGKSQVAESGNLSARSLHWLSMVADYANEAATVILEDSAHANCLISPQDSGYLHPNSIPQAERMSSQYGSFGGPSAGAAQNLDPSSRPLPALDVSGTECQVLNETRSPTSAVPSTRRVSWGYTDNSDDRRSRLVAEDHLSPDDAQPRAVFATPFGSDEYPGQIRRFAGRLGLDFLVAGLKYLNRQMDVVVESVVGSTMSSTGFVTFLDLASVTCAASTPLTNKPNVLSVTVAPEPRDIRWSSAHVDKRLIVRREIIANTLLFFGAILWSFPLAVIQAFAKAEQLARIPGMGWISTFRGGSLEYFINGYLPVLALLTLILLLPIAFEWIAVSYENRKTFSDVQRSIMGRYFYFQLANIYITVTAGSLWRALGDILDHPSNILELLGDSLPTVVGYFVSLLITKILAGLPTVVLRVGALGRMLFLRAFFAKKRLTQRELDGVYRPQNVSYGWEYPTQLLVVVICFTYACICPVILPVGAMFFVGSLMVYKKQILYVYTPIYESGGALFPAACDRTLLGLICGQLTLIGYTVIRGCYHEPIFLLPLPFFTIGIMRYFRRHYANPSACLSMERAMECDRVSDFRASAASGIPPSPGRGSAERRAQFDKNSYRQPALSVDAMEPLPYRRGIPDPLTDEVKNELRSVNHGFPTRNGDHDTGESFKDEIL